MTTRNNKKTGACFILIVYASWVLCTLCPLSLFAQPNLAGSVNIEEFDVEESLQTKARRGASDLFENLYQALQTGKTPTSPVVNEEVAHYLSAVYLQCTSKRGVCTEFLDAILETDVVVSKLSGKTQCNNLKRMWTSWVSLDMEKRLSLMTQMGLMAKVAEFNSNARRRYIQCEQAVTELLPKGPLSERYSAKSEGLQRIELGMKYINEVNNRFPNLFGSLGIEAGKRAK